MPLYQPRILETQLRESFAESKVILLIGARQVGKSTLLKTLFPQIPLFVFDPNDDEYNIKKDSKLFLKSFPAPLILDEIQFYPEILSSIKKAVDESDQTGRYILTGSQNFAMLRNVGETLAGRVIILHLDPMTFLEWNHISHPYWIEAHLNNKNLVGNIRKASLSTSVYDLMWRGMMPGLIGKQETFVPKFFSSYLQTYIERDVRILSDIKNVHDFSRFVRLMAMSSAQELNLAELGREIGIANSTALSWRNALISSFLWIDLNPYYGNTIKRLSKKPKGFFFDTGMMCYLNMINDPLSLAKHPRVGAFFETWVVNQICYTLKAKGALCSFYYWRTSHGQEVDLVIEHAGRLYPIEIKFKTILTKEDAKGLRAFRETYLNQDIAPGIIVYAGDACRYVADNVVAVPWDSIFPLSF